MWIKICGITTEEDACQAVRAGADAIGLNFYSGSPRYVAPETAQQILGALPPLVESVGLFVNEALGVITERLRQLALIRAVQCHGERHEAPPGGAIHFIPAFAVRDDASLPAIKAYLEQCREINRLPRAVLVDGHAAGSYGGTGVPAPWGLLADFQPGVPLILAGGLTPENVAEAIRIVRPYGVDVASGVESTVGRKDWDKMRRFVAAAREANSK